MGPIPGYRGVTLVTSLPPNASRGGTQQVQERDLGGPDAFYVPSPGVMMDGAVRTDTSVNYSSLFKRTFTVITYYEFPANTKMLEEMQKNFEIDHPGEDRLKYITKVFFPLVQQPLGHALPGHRIQFRSGVKVGNQQEKNWPGNCTAAARPSGDSARRTTAS